MPKKKTGQRKKHDKQRDRLKAIGSSFRNCDLADKPCNVSMECSDCKMTQRIRAFCYFCNAFPRSPACGNCGKQKCLGQGGCVITHGSLSVTGLQFIGAICDFCDTWICHSRACLTTHACSCPLKDVACVECKRTIYEHGGRVYKCAFCDQHLCEDDQLEHQASCQILESESYKCISCNRLGQLSCLRCKICFCDTHVKRKGFMYPKNTPIPCPRCGFATQETKDLSVTAKTVRYGTNHDMDDAPNDNYSFGGFGDNSNYSEELTSSEESEDN
ncbi:hypothetical protein GJ496_011768 [Pomphorhynchus laevis]|nr:hypothetical protein GJ496_011768 [Pomphorhynchus laevis]